MDHTKSKGIPKIIHFCFIDYAKDLWGAQQTVEHSWREGLSDHLTCLLRNLYAGQEATVRIRHGTTDWFQVGKGIHQGCILSPCLFNLYAEFSSVAQSCPTLCDPMNLSMSGLPVHHHFPELTQTHVHQVRNAIQPSHPWSSPSPPTLNPSQHQSLFQCFNSSHEVAKVLELQL